MSDFFNSSSKWVVKQRKQLVTSTTYLAQELLANEHTVQWWFKFCKGDKSLEDEALSGLLRTIIKADLTTAQEVAKELNNNYSMVIWNFKQIGKVKNLISG